MHIDRYRVRPGDRNILRRHRPDETGPFADRTAALTHLEKGLGRLDKVSAADAADFLESMNEGNYGIALRGTPSGALVSPSSAVFMA